MKVAFTFLCLLLFNYSLISQNCPKISFSETSSGLSANTTKIFVGMDENGDYLLVTNQASSDNLISSNQDIKIVVENENFHNHYSINVVSESLNQSLHKSEELELCDNITTINLMVNGVIIQSFEIKKP